MQLPLVYPMFVMVLITFGVGLYLLYTRVKAVRTGQMSGRYFKTYTEGTPPEDVLKAGRHYSNLFELPVLFYAACILATVFTFQSTLMQVCAWLFVCSRLAHAFIHLGRNKIYPRMAVFFVGWIAVMIMWFQLLLWNL